MSSSAQQKLSTVRNYSRMDFRSQPNGITKDPSVFAKTSKVDRCNA